MDLRKPVLAVALMSALVLTSGMVLSAEEPLQLSCEAGPDTGPGIWWQTVNFRVATDSQTVELTEPDGSLLASTVGGNLGGRAATVQIGPSVIHWTRSNNAGVVFDGTINRETGEANAKWLSLRSGTQTQWLWNGRCRRAAAKF